MPDMPDMARLCPGPRQPSQAGRQAGPQASVAWQSAGAIVGSACSLIGAVLVPCVCVLSVYMCVCVSVSECACVCARFYGCVYWAKLFVTIIMAAKVARAKAAWLCVVVVVAFAAVVVVVCQVKDSDNYLPRCHSVRCNHIDCQRGGGICLYNYKYLWPLTAVYCDTRRSTRLKWKFALEEEQKLRPEKRQRERPCCLAHCLCFSFFELSSQSI